MLELVSEDSGKRVLLEGTAIITTSSSIRWTCSPSQNLRMKAQSTTVSVGACASAPVPVRQESHGGTIVFDQTELGWTEARPEHSKRVAMPSRRCADMQRQGRIMSEWRT
jgi:hypothetical protein